MSIGCLQYFISQIFEKLGHGCSGSVLILYQQNGFSASGQMAALLLNFTPRSYFLQRKRDLEAASLPYFAPDFYVPFVLHHDTVDGCQPQPCTLAYVLGGKKWLEDAGLDLWRHSHSGIQNFDNRVVSRWQFGFAGFAGSYSAHRCSEKDRSSISYGIPGIHDQIHQHLGQVAGINLHIQFFGMADKVQVQFFPDQRPQHSH